jgi:hypothetical protein
MTRKPTRSSLQNIQNTGTSSATPKMTYKEFVEKAIKSLRQPPYKGIHVVYTNFNNAFRQYYGEDPRPIIDKLVEEGFLVSRVARGGAIILLATDVDEKSTPKDGASSALAKILSQDKD